MDTSVLSFVVAVCGSIIVLLLTVVAYFVKKFIIKVEELTTAVNELRLTVDGARIIQNNFEKNCNGNHLVVNKRLDDHAKTLKDHGERITKLEK